MDEEDGRPGAMAAQTGHQDAAADVPEASLCRPSMRLCRSRRAVNPSQPKPVKTLLFIPLPLMHHVCPSTPLSLEWELSNEIDLAPNRAARKTDKPGRAEGTWPHRRWRRNKP